MVGPVKAPSSKIALVVSDIDGTLVTSDKRLTRRAVEAASALAQAGIALSLVSSRPPVGFAMLTGPLRLAHPLGAFNGGALVTPELVIIEQIFVPEAAVRIALEIFAELGVDAWLFTDATWFVQDLEGAYVPKERHTIQAGPVLANSFEPYYRQVGKLVGSSKDPALLERCEAELQSRLGNLASAKRSQPYYLDVTPGIATKGHAVTRIAGRLGFPLAHVAVVGDAANDLSMFSVAGLAIAMGNAIEDVKQAAHVTTETNENDGFAVAIERYILSRA
jgi:Cof subfamily protein (haloacid dehalogenase superfamily)